MADHFQRKMHLLESEDDFVFLLKLVTDYIMCTVPAANTPENATIQVSFEASNQLAMCRDGTMQCSYGLTLLMVKIE